jgi:hypothetical protein
MYVMALILLVLAAVVAVGLSRQRRLQQVRALIADRGGKYLSCGLSRSGARLLDVKYIAAEGDLRLAVVSAKGGLQIVTDQPYQAELREKWERASGMLDELALHVACRSLPGHAAFSQIARDLTQGSADSVVVKEDAAPAQACRRFAPILQYIEALCVLSQPASRQVLDLVVDGRPVHVSWHVEGSPPHRWLLLTSPSSGNG